MVAEARERVDSFDEIDTFKDRALSTIVAALEAGIKRPESGAQFDALVMLYDCEEELRRRNPFLKPKGERR